MYFPAANSKFPAEKIPWRSECIIIQNLLGAFQIAQELAREVEYSKKMLKNKWKYFNEAEI